jgi:hypothetical protein
MVARPTSFPARLRSHRHQPQPPQARRQPLYGFGGKGTFPVDKIDLLLSFSAAPNARSKQITFDIVDMVYPYNAIMGRESVNKFEAAIHGLYLCMKITDPQGVNIVYGDQQAA